MPNPDGLIRLPNFDTNPFGCKEFELILCGSFSCPCCKQNAAEKPPFFLPSWTSMYAINAVVVVWVLVVGFGFGGWASVTNFVRQIDTFGLFAKCYQCKPPTPTPAAAQHH